MKTTGWQCVGRGRDEEERRGRLTKTVYEKPHGHLLFCMPVKKDQLM